jgi:hypothetical protein
MRQAKVFFAAAVLAVLVATTGAAQQSLGPQGIEGEPNRVQQWLVPSPDPGHPSHVVLFRPKGDVPFPLAVIAHASTKTSCVARKCRSRNTARWRGWWRGFAVLVPQRPGHGATGGK